MAVGQEQLPISGVQLSAILADPLNTQGAAALHLFFYYIRVECAELHHVFSCLACAAPYLDFFAGLCRSAKVTHSN